MQWPFHKRLPNLQHQFPKEKGSREERSASYSIRDLGARVIGTRELYKRQLDVVRSVGCKELTGRPSTGGFG
jgi:hypothetical protein